MANLSITTELNWIAGSFRGKAESVSINKGNIISFVNMKNVQGRTVVLNCLIFYLHMQKLLMRTHDVSLNPLKNDSWGPVINSNWWKTRMFALHKSPKNVCFSISCSPLFFFFFLLLLFVFLFLPILFFPVIVIRELMLQSFNHSILLVNNQLIWCIL